MILANSNSLNLLTDLYQLTMAYGYWKTGRSEMESVFHLFFRRQPYKGGFSIASGLEAVIEFLNGFKYTETDIEYLASLKGADGEILFDPEFFDYLRDLTFTCDISAVPEGTAVFPFEPLITVKGPLLQCQLLETPLLNLINFPTLIATKAARLRLSAQDDEVIEFGLRRAQGMDGGVTASRASYVGGCDSTSNVLAGKLYGIPIRGTHSHSWIMSFEKEIDSFYAFAKALPSSCIFLVDTYDSIQGVKNAIEVGKYLRENGKEMLGIRLDSGDITYLSQACRRLLDEAGFQDAKIVASNELDEYLVAEMKRQGSKVDVWGVGTNLVTAKDQSALDGVYKLSAIREDSSQPWQYRLKLSEQISKITNPGILQVRRFFEEGKCVADVIYDVDDDISNGCTLVDPIDATRQRYIAPSVLGEDLLVPIFKKGKCVYKSPPLPDIRKRTLHQLSLFHSGVKRFVNPHQYVVGMESSLFELKMKLIRQARKKVNPHYEGPATR
ncbi:MAG: nicotinate phosphoribosyltransferase [Waddliaceae bacterium]